MRAWSCHHTNSQSQPTAGIASLRDKHLPCLIARVSNLAEGEPRVCRVVTMGSGRALWWKAWMISCLWRPGNLGRIAVRVIKVRHQHHLWHPYAEVYTLLKWRNGCSSQVSMHKLVRIMSSTWTRSWWCRRTFGRQKLMAWGTWSRRAASDWKTKTITIQHTRILEFLRCQTRLSRMSRCQRTSSLLRAVLRILSMVIRSVVISIWGAFPLTRHAKQMYLAFFTANLSPITQIWT